MLDCQPRHRSDLVKEANFSVSATKLHFNMTQQLPVDLCFPLNRLLCCHCRCAKEARGDIGTSWHISSCTLWAQPLSCTVKQALPHHGAKEFKFKCWEEFCAWVLSEHLGAHCYATVRTVVLRLLWTSICTCALLQASLTVWCICVAESAPHFSRLWVFVGFFPPMAWWLS